MQGNYFKWYTNLIDYATCQLSDPSKIFLCGGFVKNVKMKFDRKGTTLIIDTESSTAQIKSNMNMPRSSHSITRIFEKIYSAGGIVEDELS